VTELCNTESGNRTRLRIPTHDERVLALLSDGKPHDHHQLYALGVIAHSRVASLRKKGHVIEQHRDGENYVYRLLNAQPSDATPLGVGCVGTAGCALSGPKTHPDRPLLPADHRGALTGASGGAAQLALDVAA
jgi:hypothetical protein